ncbi:MAG: hypothetical protein DWQ08_11685 [Proteobacteria bacterium]|nr:MAG: hypothetical protein DWQ08_11685 [Pseudomonadota bacterium]
MRLRLPGRYRYQVKAQYWTQEATVSLDGSVTRKIDKIENSVFVNVSVIMITTRIIFNSGVCWYHIDAIQNFARSRSRAILIDRQMTPGAW